MSERPPLPTPGGNAFTWGADLNDVLTDIRTSLDNLNVIPPYPFISGQFYDSINVTGGSSSSSLALTANTLYFVPFWVRPDGMHIDGVRVRVPGNPTSPPCKWKCGYYSNDAVTFQPADLVQEFGEYTSLESGTYTLTVDYTLTDPTQIIWLAQMSDENPSIQSTGSENTDYYHASGWFPKLGLSEWERAMGFQMSQSYVSGLPASASSLSPVKNAPLLYMRAA